MHSNWKPSYLLKSRLAAFGIGTVILCSMLFPLTTYAQNSAAKPYFDRGLQQYESGDYEGAIRSFTQVLNLDPDAYLAYYNRGLARNKLGSYDGAIADYTSAMLINSQYVNAVYGRALAKFNKGDYDGAIADSNDALHLDPKYADAYYNRGNAYYHKEDFAKAAADYAETIRLRPSYAIGYWGRGSARSKMGDARGALSDYERAVELDPQLKSTLGPSIRDLRSQLSSSSTSPSSSSSSSSRTLEIVFGASRLYEHKSGWFSLSIPENWKVEDKSSESEVIVSLYDPTQNAVVVVRVYSPTKGHTQAELGEVLRTFVNERMSSFDGYSAGDLRTQKDGSIGLAFKYNQPIEGKNYPMFGDAFIEQHNGLVGILALVMPKDQYDSKQKEAYELLNSFRVIGAK